MNNIINIYATILLAILSLKYIVEFVTVSLYISSVSDYIKNGLILDTQSVFAVISEIIVSLILCACLIMTIFKKRFAVYCFFIFQVFYAATIAWTLSGDFAYCFGREMVPAVIIMLIYSAVLFIPYKGINSWHNIFKSSEISNHHEITKL